MEFKILKNDFLNGLNAVQGVVEKKNVMPILANVLLEAKSDEVIITATDLEVAIILSVPAQVKVQGKITVLARSLFDIIRESANDTIAIKSLENDRLEIVCGNSVFKFHALSAKEFPKLPDVEGVFSKIPTAPLIQMLGKVMFAMSTDETRHHLNGVLIEKSADKSLTLVATDGHRLSLNHGKFSLEMRQDRVILPRKGVAELLKLIESTENFEMGLGERHVFVRLPHKTLFIRLVDGDFPDYSRVVPKDNPVSIKLPRQELMGALRRVSLLASDRSKGVSFYFCNDSLSVSSSNPEIGEAREELTIPYKGAVINIGFNARYFLDVLGIIPDETVRLELKDELSPCLVLFDSDKDFLSVIMPMRM